MTKIGSWQTTAVLFRDEYQVPLLPRELAASIELSCPVLLVLGLGAPAGELPMFGKTLVIQTFVYPEDWNEHLIWASMLLFIVTREPGALSLDHLIAPRFLHGRTR